MHYYLATFFLPGSMIQFKLRYVAACRFPVNSYISNGKESEGSRGAESPTEKDSWIVV